MIRSIATVQALLFVAGDEGLSLEQISSLLEIARPAASQMIEELTEKLADDDMSGLEIIKTANAYKIVTKEEFEKVIKQYAVSPYAAQISNAAMETLAIIAYKQPVTRLDIEQIRGVQCSGALQKLLLRDLIEEAGRLESPGRPKLYRTTKYFMDYFGLDNLAELPDAQELFALGEEEAEQLFSDNEELFEKWQKN
ncbi:condensin subunit ScpB [Granulicatella balaenopterae]|uniref:Segregation and condensation protein B n=1 Tax=Granulicatella balaenopterae TaxID=137733 RepID=A0A1H9HU15_9LACT|nr:SMC-Scp complex subunit ScpB [Granulicatella balaenopterae]SEQ65778.1 condensin subunit ScpB [Granulicatella balaenopterae]